MLLTKEQIALLKIVSEPLVKFINEHLHPHVKVIVECGGVELVEGLCNVKIEEFIKD